MKRLSIVLALFVALVSSAYSEEYPKSQLLRLDLSKGSYIFGLSTNAVVDRDTELNNVSVVELDTIENANVTPHRFHGVVGYSDETERQLHFYWDIASSARFSVYLGISGAMVHNDGQTPLDWSVTVGNTTIDEDDYTEKALLYTHDPSDAEAGGRYRYSSIPISMKTAETAMAGVYNAELVFIITTT